MKIILFLLCFNAGWAQCLYDIPRFGKYNYMEVFNHTTDKYEKYKKTANVEITIVIDTNKDKIFFIDTLNNYNKEYTIVDCQVKQNTIEYNCLDKSANKKCDFVFSTDKSLTVIYEPEPVIYRIKNQ